MSRGVTLLERLPEPLPHREAQASLSDAQKDKGLAMHPDTLRIAFATPEYVTEKHFDGGLANYVHRVAKSLAGSGHEIHVITLSEIDESDSEHDGTRVHRFRSGKAWRHLNGLTRYRFATTIYLLDLSFQVYRRLRRLNRQRALDLVQFPNFSSCGLFSMLLLGVPHVLRASGYQPVWNSADGIKPSLDSRAVELLERLQSHLSPHIYVPSQTLQQILAKEAGLHRVRVIRTPIYLETRDWDYSVYDQSLAGKKYLLFFGRFELRKGFHILAQALPRVLEHYPDCYAVLVGRDMETVLSPSMADYARSLCGNFAERLIVMERLPHSQLYPVIAGAHLIVLPSFMDNLPNACLESMALGRPVVGTFGASFEELIADEKTGFLVVANDAVALAEKIIYAWTHPRLDEIGQAAQEKTLEFAPERTVESLLTYYREILHEHE
jgi:glycosyltransferase involved in cell wall biosynthesis